MKLRTILTITSALIGSVARPQADISWAEARSVLEEWVAVEKSISAEMMAWREKEATLADLNRLLDVEMAELTAQLKELGDASTEVGSRNVILVTQEQQLERRRVVLVEFLDSFEPQLRALKEQLPDPLNEKLAPFWERLPTLDKATSLGVAERMQTVAAILAEAHKFNGEIVTGVELRTLADGSLGEARTLYLGLAGGYYVAGGGQEAGVGYAGPKGWQWESRPELAETVTTALAMLDGRLPDARFLSLPVPGLTETKR